MAPVGCQAWFLDKCDSYLPAVGCHGACPARIWCRVLDASCWPTQGELSVTAVSCQVGGPWGSRYVHPWEWCHFWWLKVSRMGKYGCTTGGSWHLSRGQPFLTTLSNAWASTSLIMALRTLIKFSSGRGCNAFTCIVWEATLLLGPQGR